MKRTATRFSALALTLVLAASAAGCAGHRAAVSERTRPTAPSKSEPAPSSAPDTPVLPSGTDTGDGEEKPYPVGKKGDDYILPDAATHTYTQEELSPLTREELRLARNEIYARHGRRFNSSDLADYFSEKPWYRPSIAADGFDTKLLNQNESDNLKVILKSEEALASEEISCPRFGREQFPAVDGSTATLPLSQAVYRLATGASEKEAQTHVQHSKTTAAYLNLIWDQDVTLVIAYEPGERVKERLEEANDNILLKPIGRDALVFLANGKNPVKTMTQQQVSDIYTGALTNWKELGGRDQAIKAFQRPPASGSQNLMEKLVMKGKDMAAAPQEYVFSEMEGVIAGLASYDNTGEALGYSVYYYAKNMYERPELKFMGIDGVLPSNDTIRDGSYPYTSDFYAAVRKDEPKDSPAYRLFEWLTSDDGQSLVNALGYVGIGDGRKPLPKGFQEEKEEYPGEIPLEDGEVILGDGEYLYGESGIGVYDRRMRLQKFIEHVSFPDASFYVCHSNEVLPMLDTLSGDFGLYSIAEGRWACDPVYSDVYPSRDGFEMRRSVWNEAGGAGRYEIIYDYADSRGRIIREGVSEEEQSLRAGDDEEDEEVFVYSPETFAQAYPEILARHHAAIVDIHMYGVEEATFSVADQKGMVHYYDGRGRLLFSFDKDRLDGAVSAYPSTTDIHLSCLTVEFNDGGKERSHLYVYRDGVLFKEIRLEKEAGVDSYVSNIEDRFYTRTIGNYLYVYNYQDELCAKFLNGYMSE